MKKFIEPLSGVPQGGIISPILSNLILHEFDKYIEKLIIDRERMNKEIKREIYNPVYGRLAYRKRVLKDKIESSSGRDLKLLRKELRGTIREMMRYKKDIPNPSESVRRLINCMPVPTY